MSKGLPLCACEALPERSALPAGAALSFRVRDPIGLGIPQGAVNV